MLPTPRKSRQTSPPQEPAQMQENIPWSEPLSLDYEHSPWNSPNLPEHRLEADAQAQASDLNPSITEEKPTPDPASAKPKLPSQPHNVPNRDDGDFLKGIGQEATVWTTYVKETKEFDEDMVDGWNRSLDVTLVFAALFSAILTAFVLESVKKLEPDPADQTVALLVQISQAIQMSGTTQTSTNLAPETSPEFRPTRHAVWVNCLWFFSLSISIAVSLAAMLAKQWCYYFISSRSGDTIAQTKERQKRFNGIAKWRMRGILEHLAMSMHIALALFSVGLILYLWDINIAVATGVSVVTMGTLFFYLATTLLPVMDQSCPFKTTQSVYATIFLRYLGRYLRKLSGLNIGKSISAQFQPNLTHSENGHHNASHGAVDIENGRKTSTSNASSRSISTIDESVEPFVEDALQWLILNSQLSTSIDTAIGALAIGRVEVHDDSLRRQIKLHLIKHFSDCFCQAKDGVRLQLLRNPNSLEHATNYINWIFYFGGNRSNNIIEQLEQLHNDFEGELVTRFGLALASLADQQALSSAAGRNVALWLASFVQYYEQEQMYLQEETLSVLIDGLSISGRNIRISNSHSLQVPDDHTRAQVLAIPQLIRILWKVSHLDDSLLRASIAFNLLVFVLTTKDIYSDRGKTFESAARSLAYDNRSTRNKNSNFVPFAVFSLLGLIHQNKLKLEPDVLATAALIIYETRYLARPWISMKISQLPEIGPLRPLVTSKLIQSMIQTSTSQEIQRGYLLQTAFAPEQDTSQWELRTFETMLHALRSIITAHVTRKSILHDEAMVAATGLLLKEVEKLSKLDVSILGGGVRQISKEASEQETTRPTEQKVQQGEADTEDTPEYLASSTLALILEKSNHKQCLEIAVRAVSYHTSRCNDELVVRAAEWFAQKFRNPKLNGTPTTPNTLLHICGYVRILTSMTLHCTHPSGLIERLRQRQLGETELLVREVVESLIKGLNVEKQDSDVRAFGISGLVAWRLACFDRKDYANETGNMLDQVWGLIIGHKDNKLRPEALEALVDGATLLSAIEDSAPPMGHSQAQALLELLGRFRSESNHQMQSALATSITFWGLSLGEWDFWTPEMRQSCWRYYTQAEERKKAVPALLLLGLSRTLACYAQLRLNHASIKIIASEIDRYMQQHAARPNNSLTLRFLHGFDVRRHVRDSVRSYLQETESHGPFTKSTTTSRETLRTALQYEGGEGFVYEEPQPFRRMSRGVSFSQNLGTKSPETPDLDLPQSPGRISRGVSYSGT